MRKPGLLHYYVKLYRDVETGQTIAEVPVLNIADFGVDSEEALTRLQEMVHFHIECLVDEAKPIPEDTTGQEGLYIRLKRPVRAA